MVKVISAFIICFLLSISLTSNESKKDLHFESVDIFIQFSEKTSLGAYQLTLNYPKGTVEIVGIEGGEGAFQTPPYYDESGLKEGQIIIGSFKDLKTDALNKKTRIARLHLMVKGEYKLHLTDQLLGDKAGDEITGKISFLKRENK